MYRGSKVAALALAVVLSVPAVAQSANQSGSAAAQRTGGAYDQQIRQDVQKYLQGKENLRNVKASVEDGMVTLTGSVDLLKHKQDAIKKIRGREHVAGVRDQVEVAGKSISDVQLSEQLASRLRYDRIGLGLVYNNLAVAVDDGVATVAGNVRTPADKASALDAVERTAGVKGIIDRVSVAPASVFDDELRVAIARRIYGRMPLYANDPQAPIRIVVENGKVGLFGVVNSKVDRQIAQVEAQSTPGVFSVENHLTIPGQDVVR